MRKLALILALSLPTTAGAQFLSGSTLLEWCAVSAGEDVIKAGYCLGYIRATADALQFHRKVNVYPNNPVPVCIPDSIVTNDLELTFEAWAAKHPEKLHLSASGLVISAFREAYPCKEE